VAVLSVLSPSALNNRADPLVDKISISTPYSHAGAWAASQKESIRRSTLAETAIIQS
jgi:hypothetical protein